jgi:hypothetical protein
MVAGDLIVDADRLVLETAADGVETLFAEGLKALSRADKPVISCSLPALVLGRLGATPVLTIEAGGPVTVTLALAAQPAKVLVDGVEQTVTYADGVLTVELTAGRHEVRVEA